MKKTFFAIFLFLLCVLFITFGRSIYMPIVTMVKGKETIATRTTSLNEKVFNSVGPALLKAGFDNFPDQLILLGLKEEQLLQVYAKNDSGIVFIKQYPFTATSGTLGPKLKEGDRQIPEGIYKIEYLNPNSSYYLSIKIDYPNDFDKSKTEFSNQKEMGDNIFIHGKDATIGCIPIGDDAIEEVFILVSEASRKDIKVIISPRDFRVNNKFPEIASITWEKELYEQIKKELLHLKII